MSLRPVSTNRKADADRRLLENNSMASMIDGSDSVRLTDETESLAVTSDGATPNYIYYRMYTEDGAVPSKAPAPGDPFLGRIKARSVPPPHRDTANALKLTIAKVEHIKGSTSTSLFLTPYCQSPMGDADKVTALNRIASGPGSTPLDPLAFVVKISGSALESDRRRGHITAEPDTTPDSEIRYLYYLLYADNYESPSKVAFNPEESSLGRIQAVSISPPHSPATIKRCISRVERTPAIAHADLFADITCNTPLKEDYISLLRTDCPGLSPTEPMAIVLAPSLPDGRYFIKNRAADIYWNAGHNPIKKIYFWHTKIEIAKVSTHAQWDIRVTHDGNITLISPYAPCSWVSAEMAGSKDPVPWRLIQADSRFRFYYLTTDMNQDSHNPRVPTAQPGSDRNAPGIMATLQEGSKWQIWEFIRVE